MKNKIKVTMLIAGLGLSGTPRVMTDVIENLPYDEYEISVAYKPKYPGFEGDLLAPLKSLGVATVPLRGDKLLSMSGLIDLFRHLQKKSTQIIHCWDDLCIAGRILKLFAGCRVIQTFGNPVTSKGSLLFYWVNRITSLLLDGVTFVSEGVERSFRKSDVLILKHKLKTRVIYNCINSKRMRERKYPLAQIRSKWGIGTQDIVLTNAGVFNEQKAQMHILKALGIILQIFPQAKLMLIGWGPLEKELKASVEEMGLQSTVTFTGKLSHERVFEILAITDIFVLSSLWEGFGLVIGEAMAMGKPVVATRTDGGELLVVDNQTGMLVPPGDYAAVAKAVITLLRNPDRMRQMGECARERIVTVFSPEKFAQRYSSFYKEILPKESI